jgi:glycosyltransferase involved in cell wall biosynthesis
MSISAAMTVYNEEDRIEDTLKCATWCDEIIVVDRNSTDRTREIAKKYTDKIFILNNREYNPLDNEVVLSQIQSEWVLGLTASDLIHPQLAKQLRRMTDDPDFAYDVIHIPFRRYVLGLENQHSPWYTKLNPNLVFRKKVCRIREDSVHGAVYFDTDRHYKMPESTEYCMYHLTHVSVDIMMDRHLNYCRAEGRLFPSELPLRKGLIDLFRAVYIVFFKRRTYLMGWDGVALGMAFLTYWMLRFVYIWEHRRSKAPETYAMIRESIKKAWNETDIEKS